MASELTAAETVLGASEAAPVRGKIARLTARSRADAGRSGDLLIAKKSLGQEASWE